MDAEKQEPCLKGAVMNDAKAARKGKGDSKLLAAMNASLRDLRMRNRISAVKDAATGDEQIKCQIDVFGEFTEGPFAAAGGARLNNLLSWCLGAVMPWFLDLLTKDYGNWAAGDVHVHVSFVYSLNYTNWQAAQLRRTRGSYR